MIKSTMSKNTAIYIGADGPLRKACQQTFKWAGKGKVIVVIWHTGWKNAPRNWLHLARVMKCAEKVKTRPRTLITFFGASIDEFIAQEGGDRLPLLFRLLGRDPASRDGCCPITNFARLGQAPIPFNSNDPETSLILRTNKLMGLSCDEPDGA